MTDKEKIEQVEMKLDGHTQPPHFLYYPWFNFEKRWMGKVWCSKDNNYTWSSVEGGLCENCYQRLDSK